MGSFITFIVEAITSLFILYTFSIILIPTLTETTGQNPIIYWIIFGVAFVSIALALLFRIKEEVF
jgi:hypothetical protein